MLNKLKILKEKEIFLKDFIKNTIENEAKKISSIIPNEKILEEKKYYFFEKIEILTKKGVLNEKQKFFLKNFSEKNKFFSDILISLVLDPRNFSYEEIENLIKNNKNFYENIKDSNDYIDKNFNFEYLQKTYRENPKIFLKNYTYYVSFKQKIHDFLSEYDKKERNAWEAGGVKIWLSPEDENFLIKKYGITKEELRDYSTTLNTRGEKDSGNMLFKKVLFNSILEKIDTFSGIVYRGLSFNTKEEMEYFLKNFSLTHTNQNFTDDIELAKIYTKGENNIIIQVETNKAKTIKNFKKGKSHFWFPYGTEFEMIKIINTDFCTVLILKTK